MNFEQLLDLDYLIIHKDHSTVDYDPNSGESYDVKIFCLTDNNEIDYIQLVLGKPCIYGIKETIMEEYNYYLKKKSDSEQINFLIKKDNLFGIYKNSQIELFSQEKSNEIKEMFWKLLFIDECIGTKKTV